MKRDLVALVCVAIVAVACSIGCFACLQKSLHLSGETVAENGLSTPENREPEKDETTGSSADKVSGNMVDDVVVDEKREDDNHSSKTVVATPEPDEAPLPSDSSGRKIGASSSSETDMDNSTQSPGIGNKDVLPEVESATNPTSPVNGKQGFKVLPESKQEETCQAEGGTKNEKAKILTLSMALDPFQQLELLLQRAGGAFHNGMLKLVYIKKGTGSMKPPKDD